MSAEGNEARSEIVLSIETSPIQRDRWEREREREHLEILGTRYDLEPDNIPLNLTLAQYEHAQSERNK